MERGIAVSPGVVVARAFCLTDLPLGDASATVVRGSEAQEIAHFDAASHAAAQELIELAERVAEDIGEREAQIFQAHLLMLRDRAFRDRVTSFICEQQFSADRAVLEAVAHFERLFERVPDEYFSERLGDIRDIAARVRRNLRPKADAEAAPPDLEFDEPVVIVARELFPSQTVDFGRLQIAGLVTEQGGPTSHAAILARSLGIPAVSGVKEALGKIRTGDLVAVDAREGGVIVNPGREVEAAYRKLEREILRTRSTQFDNAALPAITQDGTEIQLLANVSSVADTEVARHANAAGVGLYRTEFLFLRHPSLPDEEEQTHTYRQVFQVMADRPFVVRTLDLGADKSVPYLGDASEANPFLGWRSIRLMSEHPAFFRRQIRAILRAGAGRPLCILFPMITHVGELRRVNRLLWQVQAELAEAGIPYCTDLRRGVMIEVPAAAECIDDLLPHVHYVSIGSNDLAQYMTAADRDNPKVAPLCDPLSPGVLRMIERVISRCRAAGVPVTVCGEMAGRPRSVLALLAMGLRSFSMSPAFLPSVRELVRSVDLRTLASVADDMRRRRTGQQIRRYLDGLLAEINGDMALLETSHPG